MKLNRKVLYPRWKIETKELDRLIKEGVIAGMDLLTICDYTLYEIIFFVECQRERELRKYKALSQIAYAQAIVTNNTLSGEVGEIYEYFPFWAEEEVVQLKLEKMKRKFMAVAEEYNARKEG